MKHFTFAFALWIVALPCWLPAQGRSTPSDRQRILGTWKLVSYVRVDVASGTRSDVMGAHPSGYIHYGPDGRMMVMITSSDRKKPVGSLPTPDEAERLIRSMLAYAGIYSIDSKARTITHQIDVSWDQSRTGKLLVRSYNFDGDRLILATEPSNDPASGMKTVRTLIWKRVK